MPRKLDRIFIGPAGIPNSAPRKTTPEGVKWVRQLGLDAMEIEFVRGVRMSIEKAQEVKRIAEEVGVVLTVHAPYYVNLNSKDKAKLEASINRILESARVGYAAGAWSVAFHPGYYGGDVPSKAYYKIRDALKKIVDVVKNEGLDIWIRPELMGGLAEFGSLEEIVNLSKEFDIVMPCIDFAHLHARTRGKYNTYEEFRAVLEYLERELGREALDNMHIHISGIVYGDKGEIKHVNLDESDFNYRDLARVLKEFNVKGVLISESPNLEEDAKLFKKVLESI